VTGFVRSDARLTRGDSTAKSIIVTVPDDIDPEADETFTVTLSNPVNTPISDGVGIGTIIDNEPRPEISIGDATVAEGAGTATFNVLCATGCPAPTLTGLALLRLMGSTQVSYNLTLEWLEMVDVEAGAIIPEGTVTQTFQRGDVRADGAVGTGDALFGHSLLESPKRGALSPNSFL